MAEGPTHLLEVCRQKLSEFLCNVEHKHLAWLREIEEEAMKMFDSNLSAEPELMPKTPSQKKYRRKKRSLSLKDENNELTRKRDCPVWPMYIAEGHCWHMMAYITLVDVQVIEKEKQPQASIL